MSGGEIVALAARLKRLGERATPGPWHWANDQMSVPGWPITQWTLSPGVLIADTTNGTPGGDGIDQANAALIVELRNNLPTILTALRALGGTQS